LLVLASLAGGMIPSVVRATHLRMQMALSFVSGLMLGVAILHLLPHAELMLGSIDRAASLMLAGVVGVFLLMRFLHVHSHDPGLASAAHAHDHHHHHAHEHHHEHDHGHHTHAAAHRHEAGERAGRGAGRVRWVTILAGLSLHSLVDGAALASAVRLEEGHGWPGLVVLVVVLLHKPLDALAITATLGSDPARRRRVNIGYALVAPVAAWLAYLGFTGAGELGAEIAGAAMAFCAGAFVCVALADLMPEVQFHAHHRVKLTLALGLGVGVAAVLGFAEGSGHGLHGHGAYDGHSHAEDGSEFRPPVHDHDH